MLFSPFSCSFFLFYYFYFELCAPVSQMMGHTEALLHLVEGGLQLRVVNKDKVSFIPHLLMGI